MNKVDKLIEMIRDGRNADALGVLKAAPELASAHSDQSGLLLRFVAGFRHSSSHVA